MQIQLKQTEIRKALLMYIASQGINLEDKHVEVNFTAGRKETGVTADLDISDEHVKVEEVKATKPKAVKEGKAISIKRVTPAAESTETGPGLEPVLEAIEPLPEEVAVKPKEGVSLFG